ncbi:sigma cross-reacting protein 27A [Vibrio maritimus]|uniref:Sigma cross-reacting protein 27A n=1 Tax=Vibrio maritimus TaxID=990268 RepID=A0A090T9V7_9VIBR|nr:sigma cross-reacting protein 27A [Vibrio maritimus]
MIYPESVSGTIGSDTDTAEGFNALGGRHIECAVDDFVYDESNNVLSTPAYMLASSISEAASGIDKLVSKLVSLA